ncbi:MAG: response regulator, partial [Deltaproteobacteria bacterium]|nr:response regulator [Deltaproteobacteria bacterium]
MTPKRARVLIIDDEEVMRDSCAQALGKKGHDIRTAENGNLGLQMVREFSPDLVLLDLKMPGKSGMEILEEMEISHPDVIKIVITGYSTVSSAVEAMKKGAYDFIPKPFTPEEIRLIVDRGLEKRRLLLEREALRREQESVRRNMISLVSHELRAPLAASIQYLEVILGGMAGNIATEAREMIDLCNMRLREMLELFGRWLSLATFDPERMAENFEDVDLLGTARRSVEELKNSPKEKNVEVSVIAPENLPSVKGNRGAL